MNGVINIISKQAADTQRGFLYGKVGDYPHQEGVVLYGGRVKNLTLGDGCWVSYKGFWNQQR